MLELFSQDSDIKLIGEGGNSRIYLLNREYNCYPSAVIKVPKAFAEHRVSNALEKYHLLKKHSINTTAFLEECRFDGHTALITENLHYEDFTYLDANAHLLRDEDICLRLIEKDCGISFDDKEPEEERCFADHKFEKIENLKEFIDSHNAFLKIVSEANIYLAYDCYFFKVKRQVITEVDYIIADWDDVQSCDANNLYGLNKEQFEIAIKQFLDRFVKQT